MDQPSDENAFAEATSTGKTAWNCKDCVAKLGGRCFEARR